VAWPANEVAWLALDVIAPHARYKVWIKDNGIMPYLYGSNVVKAHVGRWSEDIPEHTGVLVYDSNDTPLVWRSTTANVFWIGD
jgi:60S ribosome subunit biogenesis protein NIP7